MTTAVQKAEDVSVEFVPVGAADKIKLSVRIIQKMIAVPTKSGRTCSEWDALKFMGLCRARRLDPLTGDAYLIGYDAKDGPVFNLITAHQAFLKRAELNPEYDGMKSGVIVSENGKILELEGDFHTEEQVLVGGWATVYFKQRKIPSHDKLLLRNYIKRFPDGNAMGRWKDDPEGQISKCAESSALRKAFPTMLGGLYSHEEGGQPIGDIPLGAVTDGAPAKSGDDADFGPATSPQPPGSSGPKPGAQSSGDSPQEQLAKLATENGLTFDAYQKWAQETGNDDLAGSRAEWSEIPAAIATRLLRSKAGFIEQVKRFVKGGAQ